VKSVVMIIRSRLTWVGNMEHIRKTGQQYKILAGKFEMKRECEISRHKWEDITKINF
jgi:hypothetical protein